MTAAAAFRAEAAKRILIKDGAYGTMIQARRLPPADYCAGLDLMKDQRGNNDLLNLTQPGIVRISIDGTPRFAGIVGDPNQDTISREEEAGEWLTIEGVGTLTNKFE